MRPAIDHVTIGTRGSQLALWQAEFVRSELRKRYPALTITVEIIKTAGDKDLETSLAAIGGKGLFTKEIERALLEHRIDLAVHSLKDLPTELPPGLVLGAITKREDVRDVFIAHPSKTYRSLADIPSRATIATGSLRRKCQLMHLRPDLRIVDLRGNLNTRFAKLEGSAWDGMVLARAGVVRLGAESRITETLSLEDMLPAPGQGALGIEIREGETRLKPMLQFLESRATTLAVTAERAFLGFLEGGCQVPIGAHGSISHNILSLDGLIGTLEGNKVIRGKIRGNPDEAQDLGHRLGKTLYAGGGKEILDEIRAREDQHVSVTS